MSKNDAAYYRQRATAERAQALKADKQEIAEIHAELARLYQALVEHEELRLGPHTVLSVREQPSA